MSSLKPSERSRSPRFPSQSLEDSLRLVDSIYQGVHRSAIDSETAFRLMGFSGKSGSSAKALGALRQFGLIEGIGDKTRVSDLTLAILEPASDLERANAIAQAAQNPDVFRLVFERFENRLPQADEPIRAFLIREVGFQKSSADDCIKSLRLSTAFSESQRLRVSSDDSEPSQNGVEISKGHVGAVESLVRGTGLASNVTQSVSVPLTRDCRADIQIYGEISGKAVKNLIRQIELLSEVWTED